MTSPDPETKALQDAIFLSRVARARQTPMSQKIARMIDEADIYRDAGFIGDDD